MSDLSEAEIVHCEHAFRLYDTDADGLMDKEEYRELMESLNLQITEKEVEETYLFGSDYPELINLPTFTNKINDYLSGTRDEERLRQALAIFDHENTGFVSASELKYMLTSFGDPLSEEQVRDLFKHIYINDDSEIRYEEFVELFRPLEHEVEGDAFSDIDSFSEDVTLICNE